MSTCWLKVCPARRWMHTKPGKKQCCIPVINVFLTSCLHSDSSNLFVLFWVTTSKLVSIWEIAALWLFIISFPFVQEWFSCSKLSTGVFLRARQSIFVDQWEVIKNCEIKMMGISFAAWNLLSISIKAYDLVLHQKVK